MSLTTSLQNLPPELRPAMAELIDAMEQRFYERYGLQRTDFESLRSVVQELAEAQKRTEMRVEELAEAQKRTEMRVEELAEAQKRTEMRIEELAEAQKRTEMRLDRLEIVVTELAEAQKRTEASLQKVIVRQGDHTGMLMEITYRLKAYAYFGSLLRKVQVIAPIDLEDTLEQHLSEVELQELLPLDLLVRGQLRGAATPTELYLAVEVSGVVDAGDVKRAQVRAGLLRRAGIRAIATVAGRDATEGAVKAARAAGVLLLQDGKHYNWEEALAALAL